MSFYVRRKKRISRDDYKPHRVENNLKTGMWTLASNIKRHGFVEILEHGEKIGLVMCVTCGVICSRNSFRKIRTHECGSPRQVDFASKDDSDYKSSTRTQQILDRLALPKQHTDANELSTSSSVFPILPSLANKPVKMETLSDDEEGTSPELMELMFSKMAENIQMTTNNESSEQTSTSASQSTLQKQRIFSSGKNFATPLTSPAKQTSARITTTTPPVAGSDGDIISSMVNSTYRIMNVIAEYEMLMLDKERVDEFDTEV